MKNYSLILIASALMLFSCNGKLKKLENQNQLLTEENSTQDSLLNDFMNSFNTFEDNLDRIKERENIISVQSSNPEIRKDGKDQINDDLNIIAELLANNREIIEDLNKKLKNSDVKNKQFRRMVARLNKQLEERSASILVLTEQLAEVNIKVDNLNLRVDELTTQASELSADNEAKGARLSEQEGRITEQTEQLAAQTERMNTAYYVAGTAKELKEKNVIVKSKKMTGDFDRSAFTKIDITQTQSIPFDSKKARILTYHPSSSYALVDTDDDKKIDQLEIKNPENFWRSSKYLVVVLN